MRDASFETLLKSIQSADDLQPLLAALGYASVWVPLNREHWPEPLRDLDLLRLVLAGDRDGLHALVVQLDQLSTVAIARVARRVRAHNNARLWWFVCIDRPAEQLAFAAFGTSEDLRVLFIELDTIRPTDLEALAELVPEGREGGLRLALRHARVLDRSRVTRDFFLAFQAQRSVVADAWSGIPRNPSSDRAQLALLFLCRLMFLYFLQRRGHLGGDPEYLHSCWQRWNRHEHHSTFFAARLKPLFFGVLNTRPERRSAQVQRFGALPYLNGGLFECHALERRHRALDLPDAAMATTFADLLQRYRFTTQDSADSARSHTIDAGIDPEMLGRVFEGLMAESVRGDTGTFFTPPAVVDRLVAAALDALATSGHVDFTRVRMLDPACGSGAFLLGALGRLAELCARRQGGEPDDYKRDLVERSLHGLDLQDDAALLCALRLWLCLLPNRADRGAVQPLPNLDRRIRQGDALIDPLDLLRASTHEADVSRAVASNPNIRSVVKQLRPLGMQYVSADPQTRPELRRALQQLELGLARNWLRAAHDHLDRTRTELLAQKSEVDLFGQPTARALAAPAALTRLAEQQRELSRVRVQLKDKKALPFFSFDVQFADAAAQGFDLILSNPPWVRAHRWPAALGRALRGRYEVCNTGAGAGGAQVDLSLLFLERAIRLLAPRGALAMLLPAKAFRSLYAGGARALLLRETRIVRLDDYSLDQRAIFQADAFTGAVVAVKSAPALHDPIRVSCHQRHAPPLEFELSANDLPISIAEPGAPWLLVPPAVGSALRTMQGAGCAVGACPDLPVHRGIFTGANEVLLIEYAEAKLGDLAWVRADGFSHTPSGESRGRYRALIEGSALRPIVRGATVGAWRFETVGWVIWSHEPSGRAVLLPRRAQRYAERHAPRLRARRAWHSSQPLARVFGVGPHTVRAKVAWQDIAPTLQATVLPSAIRSLGARRELIPLNTVYYITPTNERAALILCAYLNARAVRVFARAIAERAKDAHFRFFACTIRRLPLPKTWEHDARAEALFQLASRASAQRSCSAEDQRTLDRVVADAYGLNANECAALAEYDEWLDRAQHN